MSRPPRPPSDLMRLQHVNQQCNRFEAAWKSGTPPRIEDFLSSAPADPSLLHHLILLDLDYRRARGELPTPEEYLDRFPSLSRSWLTQAFSDSTSDTHDTQALGTIPSVAAGVLLDRIAAAGLLSESALRPLRDRLAVAPHTPAETIAQVLISQGQVAEHHVRALAVPQPVPVVLGPYTLDGWIAAGGMGNVFRATHRQMKRTVAVKVLHGGSDADPERHRRFQREVEVAGRLRHPNIVTAFDAGEQDGVTYLVTEWVDGEDLGKHVTRLGQLPVAHAVEYVRQAARGLAYAHSQGVIHRDVKPTNLILGRDGIIRVLDVGLARLAEREQEQGAWPASATPATGLTGEGRLMGTVDYMAPEQAEDPRKADTQSDVYSLGCTFYYLLTGLPPYSGESTWARLQAHRTAPIPSARMLRPDVSAALDRVVRQMMARQPRDRPAGMVGVVAALDAASAPPRRVTRRVLLAAGGGAVLAATAYYLAWPRRELPPLPRIPFDARAEQQRWAEALGVPVEKPGVAGMRFRLVPPGTFLMGTPDGVIQQLLRRAASAQEAFLLRSERQREWTIPWPYYLSATEVTVAQFRRFVETSDPPYITLAETAENDEQSGWGWHPEEGWRKRLGCSWKNLDALPQEENAAVPNLAWDDTRAFCRWLTGELQAICRLPTEVEWEFACRAGNPGLWCFGEDALQLPLYAWTKDNSGDKPQPVARKQANVLGLFDLHGNQHEWCAASEDPEQADRPPEEILGPGAAEYQPVRGGLFRSDADRVRCAARQWEHPNSLGPGFRVVQVLTSEPV